MHDRGEDGRRSPGRRARARRSVTATGDDAARQPAGVHDLAGEDERTAARAAGSCRRRSAAVLRQDLRRQNMAHARASAPTPLSSSAERRSAMPSGIGTSKPSEEDGRWSTRAPRSRRRPRLQHRRAGLAGESHEVPGREQRCGGARRAPPRRRARPVEASGHRRSSTGQSMTGLLRRLPCRTGARNHAASAGGRRRGTALPAAPVANATTEASVPRCGRLRAAPDHRADEGDPDRGSQPRQLLRRCRMPGVEAVAQHHVAEHHHDDGQQRKARKPFGSAVLSKASGLIGAPSALRTFPPERDGPSGRPCGTHAAARASDSRRVGAQLLRCLKKAQPSETRVKLEKP